MLTRKICEIIYPQKISSPTVLSGFMGWIRCWLSFALLKSAILCVRGSRFSFGRPVHEEDASLAVSEGDLQLVY